MKRYIKFMVAMHNAYMDITSSGWDNFSGELSGSLSNKPEKRDGYVYTGSTRIFVPLWMKIS